MRSDDRPSAFSTFADVLHGVAAGIFALFALGIGAWGVLIASRAFGGYQDSAPATYLAIGAGCIILGILAAAAAVFLVARRPRRAATLLAGILLVLVVASSLLLGPRATTIYLPLVAAATLTLALGRRPRRR
ncbi:MAG: hypothetical protein GEU80_05960 [Dehalococcoidia bacterium]|nr:hypothetical protein [Dehalococcoidia bacterium]